jgi:hypothetical protein
MSEVFRFLRPRNPFVLLAVMFLSLTCAMQQPDPESTSPAPPGLSGNPCLGGTGTKDNDRPIVCVDDSASELQVYPDPVRIHDVMSDNRSTPAAIQWFTKSGKGELEVRFRDSGCVRNVVCTGNRCNAVAARKLGRTGEEVRCKYDVLLSGHPTLDPETVLTGCCVAPDP